MMIASRIFGRLKGGNTPAQANGLGLTAQRYIRALKGRHTEALIIVAGGARYLCGYSQWAYKPRLIFQGQDRIGPGSFA